MPANLTPEYRRAEEAFRRARTPEEKIAALELMLATIPKHKGTDHLQADLKRRLARLRAGEASGKGKTRQKDLFHIPRGSAAGQVDLLGPPNTGKSALVAAVSNAPVQVADYPFSTTVPVPGIMYHEDVPIQLVDMPPITAGHVAPGQVGAYRQCDLILVVVNLAASDVLDQWELCRQFLREHRFCPAPDDETPEDVYAHLRRPVMLTCTHLDLVAPEDVTVFREMCGADCAVLSVSIHQPESLKHFARRVFEALQIVRVYSKLPGKDPDRDEPFTLPRGATVYDLAHKIHRELAEKLRYARAWGVGKYPGQQVPRDYPLEDKDVIELHFA